jgi:hypothetical protein
MGVGLLLSWCSAGQGMTMSLVGPLYYYSQVPRPIKNCSAAKHFLRGRRWLQTLESEKH